MCIIIIANAVFMQFYDLILFLVILFVLLVLDVFVLLVRGVLNLCGATSSIILDRWQRNNITIDSQYSFG